MNETIEMVAIEERPIDRAYNAKGQKRQTHLEVMGGALLMRFAADMLQEFLRWLSANRKYKEWHGVFQ